jgi:hypothetical protein
MVMKGAIDRREFYVLVRSLAISDEDVYYNMVIELVERVKMYERQRDLENVSSPELEFGDDDIYIHYADAEIVGYLPTSEDTDADTNIWPHDS